MATTLYVCLDSPSAPGMWKGIVEESRGLVVPDRIRWPQPAWAVLRYDNRTGVLLPDWLDWWSKNVGFALLEREGW